MHYAYRALIVKSARPHASPGTSARLAAIVCAIIAAGASSSAAQVLTKSSTVTRTTSDPVVLTIKSVDDYATVELEVIFEVAE